MRNAHDIIKQELADWGVYTFQNATGWLRSNRSRIRSKQIKNAEIYVSACRTLLGKKGCRETARLLAFGFNYMGPRRWLGIPEHCESYEEIEKDAPFWRFKRYINEVCENSRMNYFDAPEIFSAWKAGIHPLAAARGLNSELDCLLVQEDSEWGGSNQKRILAWRKLTSTRQQRQSATLLARLYRLNLRKGTRVLELLTRVSPAYRFWVAGYWKCVDSSTTFMEAMIAAHPSWVQSRDMRQKYQDAGIPAVDHMRLWLLPYHGTNEVELLLSEAGLPGSIVGWLYQREARISRKFNQGYVKALGALALREPDINVVREATLAVLHESVLEPGCRQGYQPYVSNYHVVRALTPQYPNITTDIAVQVFQGVSPREISKGLLTKKEAHSWLASGYRSIAQFLVARYDLPPHRSIKVLRWLQNVKETQRWNSITRIREAPMPGGEVRQFTALDIIDEIDDDDIHTGRDSVTAVLRRSAQRLGEKFLKKFRGNYSIITPVPEWWENVPQECTLLQTPAAIVREGTELRHCVGGYVRLVERGQCIIVSVKSPLGRSTVELSSNGQRIHQHRSHRNGQAPYFHVRLVETWVLRNKHREESRERYVPRPPAIF
jgi:hypothetical protein